MSRPQAPRSTPGLLVLFGSGEMSPTGRKIHELVFKKLGFTVGVRVGILETPTGFEVNAIHGWPERMEDFFKTSLKNYKPEVTRIRAWAKGGDKSTDDPRVVDALLDQDYIYCGAGSPGYTVRHLAGSRAWENMKKAYASGTTLCLGSASAIAVGHQILPVYEIFKAGSDLHWDPGLTFFDSMKRPLVIVPHWNNKEGDDFDTTRCWMGVARFEALVRMLPKNTILLGIDEQTACIFDSSKDLWEVAGIGSVHIRERGKERDVKSGGTFILSPER